jgi:hypothetical protein
LLGELGEGLGFFAAWTIDAEDAVPGDDAAATCGGGTDADALDGDGCNLAFWELIAIAEDDAIGDGDAWRERHAPREERERGREGGEDVSRADHVVRRMAWVRVGVRGP